MPQESRVAHRQIQNPCLPYATNSSPLSGPQWVAGSRDVLTSVSQIAEKRPGFAQSLETTARTFSSLQRIFIWEKWDETFVAMFCDVSGGVAKVYKYQFGSDTTSVLIFTSASAEPFDFVCSNNTCYFGNDTEMRKYLCQSALDITTYKWGIDAPAAAPTATVSGASSVSQAFTAAAGTNWTNPTFCLTDDANYAVYNAATQDLLKITAANYALPAGINVTGFQVTVKGNGSSATTADRQIQVGLTKDGATVYGGYKTVTLKQTTDSSWTLGSTVDLWGGASWLDTDVEAATFGVLIRDADTTAAALNINYVTTIVYYQTTTGSGTLNAATGYNYCYTYSNSGLISGQESSPSEVCTCTGVFSNRSVDVDVIASTDPQVDEIRVYRTTDGGSTDPTLMEEIFGSPFANATATVNDNTDDADLNASRTAPAALRNDPPTPGKGLVWAQGRIWLYANSTTYFSGLEEISNGVPEECFPSGLDGNNYPWDGRVRGQQPMEDGIAVSIGTRIWKIEGDSLDTFRRYRLLDKRGWSRQQNATSVGTTLAWFDMAGQAWISDLGEVGKDIRNDLALVNQSQSAVAVHISGNLHHFIVMDGARGILFVYDLDLQQWLPPWDVGERLTAICSAETSAGDIDLMIGRNGTKALKQTLGVYADDGVTYDGDLVSSLFPICPDAQPQWTGVVDYVAVDRNAVALADVLQLTDDDPEHGTFFSIFSHERDPERRTNKPNLVQKVYMSQPDSPVGESAAAQRVSIQLHWDAGVENFKLYAVDIGYHELPEK